MIRNISSPVYRVAVLAMVLSVVLSLGVPARAEPLTIATVELPPYGMVEDGAATGLVYEIGNAIATAAKYVPHNSLVPFSKALTMIEEGTADMVIMFPNPKVREHAVNMGLVLPSKNVVMGRAETRLQSFRDLRGKMVATVRGARYDDRISPKNGVIVYPVDNYAQCLKLLLSKQVDFVAGPETGLLYSARRQSIPLHALGSPLLLSVGQGSVFLSIHSATVDKRERIASAVRELLLDGTIEKIRRKY